MYTQTTNFVEPISEILTLFKKTVKDERPKHREYVDGILNTLKCIFTILGKFLEHSLKTLMAFIAIKF